MIRESSLMAPYIKHPTTTRGIMLDVMLCMAALYLIAAFYYGWRAVMLGVVSMAVCMLCEWLGSILRLERHNAHDISALVTGMMIPLMLPASIPYYVVIVADVFAILLVKYAFGGTGYNLFNPAAGGLLFVTLCWPQLVFAYPATFTNPEVFGEVTARTTNSIAYVLSVGSVPSTDMTSVMLGLAPRPHGYPERPGAAGLYAVPGGPGEHPAVAAAHHPGGGGGLCGLLPPRCLFLTGLHVL